MNKMSQYLLMSIMMLFYTPALYAALAIDRSRVVINEGTRSVGINITNKNTQQPYLAQIWIESDSGKKIHAPFMALPPLQRIEAGSQSKVRIETVAQGEGLPTDREQVFYLNIREIPPKSEHSNVLMLAMQTRIKVFYRPQSLKIDSSAVSAPGADTLTLEKTASGYEINNPTAYYFSFVTLRSSMTSPVLKGFSPVMVAPFSRISLGLKSIDPGSTPVLSFVNDFGSQQRLQFTCSGTQCKAVKPVDARD